MPTHVVGQINPDPPAFDLNAPVATNDTATVASQGVVTIDVLANDFDVDPGDFYDANGNVILDPNGNVILGIGEFTDWTADDGQVHGTLQAVGQHFVFTADDPYFDTGTHTVTFEYTALDQWGKESGWATATITVTGNSVEGETISGLNHPNTFTPDSDDPRIHFHLAGNDILSGGNNKDTIDAGAGADTVHGENGDDSLIGGDGGDLIFGDNGKDTIDGGSGDDTLSGGNGHDLFVFGFHFGHDVITDYDKDQIQVHPAEWGSFSDLMAHAVQDGHDVVITSDDGHDSLTLLNIGLHDLSSRDFLFV
jgi:hypothetical protein